MRRALDLLRLADPPEPPVRPPPAESYRVDGHDDSGHILPQYIDRDMLIYDVGGGARPASRRSRSAGSGSG